MKLVPSHPDRPIVLRLVAHPFGRCGQRKKGRHYVAERTERAHAVYVLRPGVKTSVPGIAGEL
jgi:hypothetical protein